MYKGKNNKITHIIEFSTLTGACMIALGLETAGLFSNDDHLADNLLAIAK
jgi:leucyl aminopeptidase